MTARGAPLCHRTCGSRQGLSTGRCAAASFRTRAAATGRTTRAAPGPVLTPRRPAVTSGPRPHARPDSPTCGRPSWPTPIVAVASGCRPISKPVDATGKAGLYLRVIDPARSRPPEVREQLSLSGSTVWTRRHVEAEVRRAARRPHRRRRPRPADLTPTALPRPSPSSSPRLAGTTRL